MRILAEDFNTFLPLVAREMRRRDAQTTLAAALAWAEPCASEATSDSSDMFLICPVASTQLFWGPSVFTSAIADEHLPSSGAGQAYPLASYLPRGGGAVTAMTEIFARSTETWRTQGW